MNEYVLLENILYDNIVMMARYAELQITLERPEAGLYMVEMEFDRPDDRTERPPVHAVTHFDFTALTAASLNPQAYGALLAASIFPNDVVWSFFSTTLAVAEGAGLILRVRLLIDPGAVELNGLRWETLINPAKGTFLATDENILFSRYLYSSDWRRVTLPPRGNMRALVVVANPTNLGIFQYEGRNLDAVDVAGEIGRARQALKGVEAIDTLTSAPGKPGQVSLDGIVTRLRQGYDILYLVAHGAMFHTERQNPNSPLAPRLWLEKADGSADVIDGNALIDRIHDLAAALYPRLVVLAACQSAGRGSGVMVGGVECAACARDQGALASLGPRLAEVGIPAVIAMQGNVSMNTVAQFIPAFFAELIKDGQLERAAAAARSLVREQADWWMPVLFTRLKDGYLFDVNAAAPSSVRLPSPNILPEVDILPVGSRMPYLHNPTYVGRQQDLLDVAWSLLYTPPNMPRRVVVTGVSGVGKTELAVEYAYRYGQYLTGVHWIDAAQNMLAEIAACGAEMGFEPWPRTIPEQANATLQAWRSTPKRGLMRLVVLDGVEDPALLREWLPKFVGVQVLITSRRTVWPRDLDLDQRQMPLRPH